MVSVIILAGGLGRRFYHPLPKQFHKVEGRTIIEHTVSRFNRHPEIKEILLVINDRYLEHEIVRKMKREFPKIIDIVTNGESRRLSVSNALKVLSEENEHVLIHDGTRPFVSDGTISRCIEELRDHDAIYPAVDLVNSIIYCKDQRDFVRSIPERSQYLDGQTPQGFRVSVLREAHRLAGLEENVDATIANDCGLIARYQLCEIKIIEGNRENIKITYPEDILLFRSFLES
jgi:2-C-methyl-D-erythritol 4-phosphate cytidylyltransferase